MRNEMRSEPKRNKLKSQLRNEQQTPTLHIGSLNLLASQRPTILLFIYSLIVLFAFVLWPSYYVRYTYQVSGSLAVDH